MPQSITQHPHSLKDYLMGLTVRRRFWLGLFASAALAHFIPSVVFAAFGQWTNTVMAFSFIAFSILMLMLLNLLGDKTKMLWLPNTIVLVGLLVLSVVEMTHQHNNLWHGLAAWWTTFVGLAAMFTLNVVLFFYYKRIAALP